MQEHREKITQFMGEQRKKLSAFFYDKKIRMIGMGGVRALLFIVIAWAGWGVTRIATGMQDGIAPDFVPQTLPLLLSGVVYIDRFAAVVVTILALALLLELVKQNARPITSILGTGILVLGVLTAATPLTLVAWTFLILLVHVRGVAKKEQKYVLASMGALMGSVLLLSGGAFLADMTIVATISAELARPIVLLALALLFGGSLASTRWLTGAYLLVPVYITLRLCLFFLGTAPAVLITLIAFVAAMIAGRSAYATTLAEGTRAYAATFFLAIPLTMIAVNVQNISAVQAFLFGGITLAASAIFGQIPYEKKEHDIHVGEVLLRAPFPGTFSGMGFLLIFLGLAVLGEQSVSRGEQIFLLVISGLVLWAWGMLLVRTVSMYTHRWVVPTLVQAVRIAFLAFLAGGFSFMLAYLGTTIGGEVPDAQIEIAFTEVVLTITPWMLFLVSAMVFIAGKIFAEKKPEAWSRIHEKGIGVFKKGEQQCKKIEEMRERICSEWEKKKDDLKERIYQGMKQSEAHAQHKVSLVVVGVFIGSIIIILSL